MKIKILLLCCLIIFCFSLTAFSQTETASGKKAVIAEIIKTISAESKMKDTLSAIIAQFDEGYPALLQNAIDKRTDLNETEKESLKKELAEKQKQFSKRFNEKFLAAINMHELIEQLFYPLYDKFFTEAELKDLLEFYKSPTGQKFNEITPQFSVESLRLSQEYLIPKLGGIIDEMIREDTQTKLDQPPKNTENPN